MSGADYVLAVILHRGDYVLGVFFMRGIMSAHEQRRVGQRIEVGSNHISHGQVGPYCVVLTF